MRWLGVMLPHTVPRQCSRADYAKVNDRNQRL